MNVSMVSEHIARMEESDGSSGSEYETALKHASASALLSKISLMRINEGQPYPPFTQLMLGPCVQECLLTYGLLIEVADKDNINGVHARDG